VWITKYSLNNGAGIKHVKTKQIYISFTFLINLITVTLNIFQHSKSKGRFKDYNSMANIHISIILFSIVYIFFLIFMIEINSIKMDIINRLYAFKICYNIASILVLETVYYYYPWRNIFEWLIILIKYIIIPIYILYAYCRFTKGQEIIQIKYNMNNKST